MSTELQRVTLRPHGFSAQSRVGVRNGFVPYTRDTVNIDTHRGEPWGSRGYKIYRAVAAVASAGCASWLHTHTDGGSTPIYWAGGGLYPETGSDLPTALATGLTATFKPVFASMDFPAGMSVFFNGVNSEARLIREKSGSIEAVLFDFPDPVSAGTITTPANGTTLIAGTYHVALVWEDADGPILVETGPTFEKSIVVVAGDSLDIDISALTPPTRATHWSVYVAAPGASGGVATDAGSSYLREKDSIAIGTTGTSVTAIVGVSGLTHINEFFRTATIPLANANLAWLAAGRLWIGSSSDNRVFFSERDNPNHWYTTNEVTAGAETSWSDAVIGGVAAFGSSYIFTRTAIHRVYGDLTRDQDGANPTFDISMGQEIVASRYGLVGPNAITQVGNRIYFYSDQGLAGLEGNSTALVSPDDEQGILDELDPDYLDRIVLTADPDGYISILAPRFTNSTRPLDGASVAGVADRIYRWDYRHGLWAPPLAMGDITHINARQNPAAGGTSVPVVLMASSPNGYVHQLGFGWSGGGPLDVSGAVYDGKLATAVTATSVTFTQSGISADQFNGMTVALFYPTDDTGFAGLVALRTITDVTVSGSSVTVVWVGALTVPTASGFWTARVAGLTGIGSLAIDLRRIVEIPPGFKIRVTGMRFKFQHMIGEESVT